MHGGRWNPPGVAAVYLAESRALAALEILVHAPREALRLAWCVIAVEVPDDAIKVAAAKQLPDGWRDQPSSPGARRLGAAWLAKEGELAMALPSVIVPQERTLLANPRHPAAARLKAAKAERFVFDPRL